MEFALRSIALFFALGVQMSSARLLWSDEFSSYSSLNNWYVSTVENSHNSELQYYTSRTENVDVRSGHLVLTPIKENYGSKQYTSGRIQSNFAWKYGRVEVRAKLPNGYGLWPAIWMMPRDSVYGGWPESGEIDICEARGEYLHQIQSTIHFGDTPCCDTHRWESSGDLNINCNIDQYHVYEMVWTENSLVFILDGVQYYSINLDKSFGYNYNSNRQPFDQYFYLILNVAVGGHYVNDPTWNTVWNYPDAEMWVDYVRVYSDTNVPSGGGDNGGSSSDCPCVAKTTASYDDMCGAVDWACYDQNYANVAAQCTDRLAYCCGGLTHRCDVEEVRDLVSAVYESYDSQLNADHSCDFGGTGEHRCDSSSSGTKCLIKDSASKSDICNGLIWACGWENTYVDVSSECNAGQDAVNCCNVGAWSCDDTRLREAAGDVFQAYYEGNPQASSCDFGGVCYLSTTRAATTRGLQCTDGYGG